MADEQSSSQFPDFTIPDSQKDKTYHKKFVEAITSQSINSGYNFTHRALTECYDYYNGEQTDEAYRFLQEAENGDVLPALWKNYNKIKNKVDLLLGELDTKGYDINVRTINKEAKVRKLEEKQRKLVEARIRPDLEQLQQAVGMNLGLPQEGPQNEQEVHEFFDYSYKESAEIVMEAALKWLAKKHKWDYERRAMFRDILIAGRCVAKLEIVDGLPKARRIDPRLFIFDTAGTDDYLSDATYFGEIRYMNFADAANEYNLTLEEIKTAHNAYSDHLKSTANVSSPFDRYGSELEPFKTYEDGELRVLVECAYWVDTKSYNHKVSTDKYGNDHVKRVDAGKEGKNIKKTRVKIWRQATLVGGSFMKEWGEVKNQPRDVDNLSDTAPPYKIFIPNYLNGRGVSKVMQLKALQDLKNIAMYNVELAMARAGTRAFVYDISQTPEEWDITEVMKYLKSVGIIFIDSKKDNMPSQFNQFQQIDLSMSQTVNQYIEISMMIDREMDAISGINEARQGMVQRASQAVGVTQSAILQSNLATESYFKGFETFCSDILNHQARLVKIAWAGKERFAPIIGDAGVDFLQEDIDMELNDYGVFLESTPPLVDNTEKYEGLITAAMQAGQISLVETLELLVMEPDVKTGIRRLKRQQAEKEAQEQQYEQQMQQQALQAAAQEKQADIEGKMQVQQAKTEGDLQKQQLANKGSLDVTKLKSAADWRTELHKARMSIREKAMELKAKKEEAKNKPKPSTK